MADAIVTSLEVDPTRLVVHVCGSFHCERRLGITEMVERIRCLRQQQPPQLQLQPPPGAAASPAEQPRADAVAVPAPKATTRQLVVVMYPEADCHEFRGRHEARGDFVILTDASIPRSHDYMGGARSSAE